MKIVNYRVPKKFRPYLVHVLRQWSFGVKMLGLPVKRILPEDTETYFNKTNQIEGQFFFGLKTAMILHFVT